MNQKIFIIEDDINLCSALTAKFSVLGFKTISFSDSEILNITNKIKIHRPDYIILNLNLPSVNGRDLLSAIKADEQLADIPVYIFSDADTADTKDRALSLGAAQFFAKDKFELDEFVERVAKIISNQEKLKNKKTSKQ
jgi:DNA-binding response OmpR family regulator